jgi:SpoVK/Ycf46/Vps4 family AAA+-type ATPase
MLPERILKLDIQNKRLLSVLYGKVDDFFITADIIRFNFEEIFYLYLKNQGFDSVVFYNSIEKFYSFSDQDILRLNTDHRVSETIILKKRKRRGPLGEVKNPSDSVVKETTIQDAVIFSRNLRKAYKSNTERIYDTFDRALNNPKYKIAIVIQETMLEDDFFTKTDIFKLFIDKYVNQNPQNNQHKIIFNCGTKKTLQGEELPPELHNQLFTKVDDDNFIPKNESDIKIGLPEKDEIENLLNYERIHTKLSLFEQGKYEKLKLKLLQKRTAIIELEKIDKENLLNEISNKSAWDQLNDFVGIEPIVEKFKKIINTIKKNKERENPIRIRPHMCFKGNPGTGKTAIAEIFSEILTEEGVLSIGGLVKVTVEVLISQNVGETRPKTQKVCDDAIGRVLFIDEAYGLHQEDDEHNYGKEAIEVLIQFMENNEDSLIILAGYTEDINTLLEKGNKGFISRFQPENHFDFKDYNADALFQIAILNLKYFEFSHHFKDNLKKAIEKMASQKDQNWGNARSIENLVQDIISNYDSLGDSILDVKHIPHKWMSKSNDDLDKSYEMLNSLIGLNEMKNKLNDILITIKADKLINEKLKVKIPENDLNFVFTGNPGTGKTTVARLMGEILCNLQLISSSEVIELTRDQIIGKYKGHTGPNVTDKFDKAIGKVLFIDEAYAIYNNEEDDFGKEAIDTIVANLTKPKYKGKMAVIFAGYPDEMQEFIQKNPGLKERIKDTINFEDYSNEELWDILISKITPYKIADDCKDYGISYFEKLPRNKSFANARTAEKLLSILKLNLKKRIIKLENPTEDELLTILSSDFPNYNNNIQNIDLNKGISDIDSLIGLKQMKKTLNDILNSIKADKLRNEIDNVSNPDYKLNFVFTGNPGTGKTTVARLMGEILCNLQVISSSEVIELTRDQIIGEYQGQTAPNITEAFDKAIGKVLFIDEAYAIYNNEGDDFGKEAIDTIVANLTKPIYMGKMAVIFAGYPDEMREFIRENPGMERRINYTINFEDYSNEELWDILMLKINSSGFKIADDCKDYGISYFERLPRNKSFANAGAAEKLLGILKSNLDNRIIKLENPSDDELLTILSSDFPNYNNNIKSSDLKKGISDIDSLIGLKQMKKTLNDLFNSIKADKLRNEKRNVRNPDYKLNFVFTGNPGTGKTTVARMMGEILCNLQVISSSEVIELTRDQIIGEYQGQTAPNITEAFDKAIGKVLFIDEAYAIYNNEGDDFGKEAIDTIVANLTKPMYMGNMAVIFAGYPDEMRKFIQENPGLERRINHTINFEDYSNEELWNILMLKINSSGFKIADDCKDYGISYFEKLPRNKSFANAGAAEKLLGILKSNLDYRIIKLDNPTEDELFTILSSDFPNYNNIQNSDLKKGISDIDSLIGLKQMKKTLNDILNSIKADKLRNEIDNVSNPDYKLNFVFTGNPGTGKTTVARMMGEILCNLQVISSSEVIELTRDQIIGEYLGQTAPKITDAFDKAIGKVLFIDEAYAIINDERDIYGKEAIDTIVANLTKPMYMGNMAVIFAGYPDEMREFIHENPGLERRINYTINFEDYSNEELWDILMLKINSSGFKIADDCKDYGISYFEKLPRNKSFANAGAAEKLLGILKSNLDNRIIKLENPSKDELLTILSSDFPS